MESAILFLLLIVIGFLNIILFFKIWGMTSNIKLLTELYIHDKGIKELKTSIGHTFIDKDGNNIITTN